MKRDSTYFFQKYAQSAPVARALWRAFEATAIAQILNTDLTRAKRPVLDIGCGFGESAAAIFTQKIDVGIDIAKNNLAVALLSGHYDAVEYMDARNLTYADNRFGTIISVGVLEHIPHVEAVLRQARRVLKPGGRLIYSVPTTVLNGYLFYPKLFTKLRMGKLASGYQVLFHRLFGHRNVWAPGRWKQKTKQAGFAYVTVAGTTPRTAVYAFDRLLPRAVFSPFAHTLFGSRFTPYKAHKIRKIARQYASFLKDPDLTKANIIVVATK